jgi:hypothetical protein
MWSLGALASSRRCKGCPITSVFCMKGILTLCFMCVAYFALYHNMRVEFDPTYPSVDMGAFIKTDCKSMYGEVT